MKWNFEKCHAVARGGVGNVGKELFGFISDHSCLCSFSCWFHGALHWMEARGSYGPEIQHAMSKCKLCSPIPTPTHTS